MRKLKNSELDRLSIEDFKTIEKTPLIVILDNALCSQALRLPRVVPHLVRTCLIGFGVNKLLGNECE